MKMSEEQDLRTTPLRFSEGKYDWRVGGILRMDEMVFS